MPKFAGHDGEPFSPRSIERGRRSVRAVMLAVAEMYIKGVSTRQDEPSCAIGSSPMANAVMREFGIERLSSSQVSRAAKLLDEELDARAKPRSLRQLVSAHYASLNIMCSNPGRVRQPLARLIR